MIRLFSSLSLIVLGFAAIHIFFWPALERALFLDWIEKDIADDYIGAFYLLDELHRRLPANQFQQAVDAYPDFANIPLAIFAREALSLSGQQQALLNAGHIYVSDPDQKILYYRLSDSNKVARFGPIVTYDSVNQLSEAYDYLLLVILALAVFFWIFNLQRKLKRLDIAARRLGQGDFGFRASELGRHSVGHLNRAFNRMAERIEGLIKGHKSLTTAIAHELRTPVSRIRFQLDMVYEETSQLQQQVHLRSISDDIDELSDLIDELLTYAWFDRKLPAPELQLHSLHESLCKVIAAISFDSKITIEYRDDWYATAIDQCLYFEPGHLERAILNLIRNAQKYANSKVIVQVKKNAEQCSIFIDDDGPGIEQKDQFIIFEPFKRLDNSRTRLTGGYGLGLAIAKQIAQWHNGTINVDIAPAGGARFIFSWPINKQ